MYRIKNDKRTKRSIERITQGLTECLNKKKLTEIGVTEIAEVAGVSRATFYRIFDTPSDVLDCLCETIVQELENSVSQTKLSEEEDYVLHYLRFLINHADSLKAIFRAGRMDLLEKAIRTRTDWMLPALATDLSETEIDYVRCSFTAILMAILYVWYQHGCRETAAELAGILKKVRHEQDNFKN